MKRIGAFIVMAAAVLWIASAARAAEPLMLLDFEGADSASLSGASVSTEQAKTGKASAKWRDQTKHPKIVVSGAPKDWTPWDTMDFWMYSEKANGAQFMFLVYSENDAEEGADYYYREITVDWTGWKHFQIPLLHLDCARVPVGFNHVTGFQMSASGWSNEPRDDTVLYLDSVRLVRNGLTLRNASFDEGVDADGIPEGWEMHPTPRGSESRVEVVEGGRTGKALRLLDTNSKAGIGIEQRMPVMPGATYTFAVWKKGGEMGVYLDWLDADGKRILPEQRTHAKNKDPKKWERFSVERVCPPNAKTAVFWLYSYIAAETDVLLDDTELGEAK